MLDAGDTVDGPMGRIKDSVINSMNENSNRRQLGKGMIGNLLDRQYHPDRMNSYVRKQMDDLSEHR